MEKSVGQVEKNVSASFAYVKKDMLMLNDAFSDLHDKIQHLSLNHAMLLEQMEKLLGEIAKSSGAKVDKKVPMKKKAVKKKSVKKTSKKNSATKKKSVKKKPIKKIIKETETVTYE
jgi:hypothetical protein